MPRVKPSAASLSLTLRKRLLKGSEGSVETDKLSPIGVKVGEKVLGRGQM
jgi:hypothetical protein